MTIPNLKIGVSPMVKMLWVKTSLSTLCLRRKHFRKVGTSFYWLQGHEISEKSFPSLWWKVFCICVYLLILKFDCYGQAVSGGKMCTTTYCLQGDNKIVGRQLIRSLLLSLNQAATTEVLNAKYVRKYRL